MRFVPIVALAASLTAAVPNGASGAVLPYTQDFTGADGAPWPSPWTPATGLVTTWDLQSNRGRLNGLNTNVARMILPGYSAVDVEVQATLEFSLVHSQGIGFYVRQNGGSLQATTPHGQGYAIFLKGSWGWPEDLGIWREIDGVETQFATGYFPVPGGLQNGVRYLVRFRVTQVHPDTTLLQARTWIEGQSEPGTWNVEVRDTEPLLQGTAGSFAIDIYNYSGGMPVYLDDIEIRNHPELVAVGGTAPAPRTFSIGTPRPHPVNGNVVFELAAPRAGHGAIEVLDLGGRRVAQAFTGAFGEGVTRLAWRPVDGQGRRLAAGVYFLALRAGSDRASRRIVITD